MEVLALSLLQEKKTLEVGEFCEISNGSQTDPGKSYLGHGVTSNALR